MLRGAIFVNDVCKYRTTQHVDLKMSASINILTTVTEFKDWLDGVSQYEQGNVILNWNFTVSA